MKCYTHRMSVCRYRMTVERCHVTWHLLWTRRSTGSDVQPHQVTSDKYDRKR